MSVASVLYTSPTRHLSDVIGKNGLIIDGDWVESKDQDPNGDVRLVQLADVGEGVFLNKSSRFLTHAKAAQLGCTFLQDKDILVARMPDPIGRACIFPGDPRPCVTVVDVCIIRPDPQIADPRWLCQTINSLTFRRAIEQFIKGTTRQRISRTNLEKLPIPLPSLSEQFRIAAILDKADDLRAKRRVALHQVNALRESVFIDMFGSPTVNPKSWPLRSLSQVALVTTGSTPPSASVGMFGGAIPFVTPADLDSGQPVCRTVTEAGAKESRTVRAGAALVCCIGSIGKTGKTTARSAFNQQINAVEWGAEVDDDYGFTALQCFKPILARSAPSSLLPILKKSSFEKLRIPVPPLSLQRQFADFVRQTKVVESVLQCSNLRLDELFNSLQKSAFIGLSV